MPNLRSFIAPAAALVLICAVVACEWYENVGKHGGNTPVSAVTAAPSPGGSLTVPKATPTPKAVVFVVAPHSTEAPASGSAEVASPTTAPLAGTSTTIPELPSRATESTYVAPPPPVISSQSAAPEIISMEISSPVVRSGEQVSGSVETSTNVASVEARIGGYSSNLRKTGAGRFTLEYRVPFVPFFLKKTYTVLIVARNTRGDAVSTTFPITVR